MLANVFGVVAIKAEVENRQSIVHYYPVALEPFVRWQIDSRAYRGYSSEHKQFRFAEA